MRRPLLIGGAVLGGFLLTSLFALWLFYGRIGAWVIRDKVVPRLEARLGQSLDIGEIDVERGKVILRKVSVAGQEGANQALIEIDKIEVTYDYGASWLGNVVVHDLKLEGLLVRANREADGSSNFQSLVDTLRNRKKDGESKSGSSMGSMRPRTMSLSGGEIHFIDKVRGVEMHALGVRGQAEANEGQVAKASFETAIFQPASGPMLSLGESVLTLDPKDPIGSARAQVSEGKVKLWNGMTLTGITGQVAPGDNLQELIIDLGGSYGGASEKLWHAQGWLDPKAKRGQLDVKANRFTLNRISAVLQDSVLRDYENTSVDAELSIEVEEGIADISGSLDLTGLSFFHEKLSEDTIKDLSLTGELMASFDSTARTVKLLSVSLETKGVQYLLSGEVALKGGQEADGSIREFPRLALQAKVPSADCQAVLDSIPAPIIPKLQGFRLRGDFSADVAVAIDWSDLEEKTELDWTINLPQCSVLSPSSEFNTQRLMTGFAHQTLVGPGQFESVEIGMASTNYAQIFDVSPYFLNAVLTHEDSRFYSHKGFISREFKAALIANLEAGTFKRGASSITMQMVKNVFLYRDKTMSRKIQELFLTWYVEKTLEKNRILEIYINAIEYGPGIYGIVKASQTYFDKHPRDIEPIEAAFLAQLLPAPRRRYFEYCKDKLGRRSKKKIERLLGHMNKRDRLTDEELAEAIISDIEFNPEKERELCKRLPSW